MRAESVRTAILGAFILIVLIVSPLCFHVEPPSGKLRAPDYDDTLDTISPIILSTSPFHGQIVYPDVDIVIQFNESMNTSSFAYEFISGWDPGMTWAWESTVYENDTIRGAHANLFGTPSEYMFNVTYAEDLSGNPLAPGPVPNPWNWTVETVIVSTVPADGETNVSLYQDIIVNFSGPANVTTVWIEIHPDIGSWTEEWGPGETSFILSHAVPFFPCTTYIVSVYKLAFHYPSLVPNPWSFTTVCSPFIIATDPCHEQASVPLDYLINVTFNKPMNITSVNWTIIPHVDLTPSWGQNDTFLTLSHVDLFMEGTLYVVDITQAKDLEDNDLVAGPVPNPWCFNTISCAPYIVSTDPYHKEMNVSINRSIAVEFSHRMDPLSLVVDINPYVDLYDSWMNDNRILELSHPVDFEADTQYTIEIWVWNEISNPIVPGPVPNPWNFTTCCPLPEILSTDPFDGEGDVPLQRSIEVVFDEEMKPQSLEWTIDPSIPLEPVWSDKNKTLTFEHNESFEELTTYTMHIIKAESVCGQAFVSGSIPNPWNWTTGLLPSPPAPPRNITAFLSGSQLRDVTIGWQLSIDDFPGGNVSHYEIYRGTDSYNSSGLGYSYLASVPKGVSLFVDQLVGQDEHSYFYFVCTVSADGSSCTSDQAAKFTRPLANGPNLISIPLIRSNESIEHVLQTVIYDKAWFYDSLSWEWKWYMKDKTYSRGLSSIDHTMGLWINVTEASSLTVAGVVPSQTSIQLYHGWNLVSFPSFNTSYTVADLKVETGATRVEGMETMPPFPPHLLRVLGDADALQAGYGYWVRVEADTVWVVSTI